MEKELEILDIRNIVTEKENAFDTLIRQTQLRRGLKKKKGTKDPRTTGQ